MEYQLGYEYYIGSKSRDNQQKRKQWKITSRFILNTIDGKFNCILHFNIATQVTVICLEIIFKV